jgi:hypothetical protein
LTLLTSVTAPLLTDVIRIRAVDVAGPVTIQLNVPDVFPEFETFVAIVDQVPELPLSRLSSSASG